VTYFILQKLMNRTVKAIAKKAQDGREKKNGIGQQLPNERN
jgi:hypothetical protein